MSLERMENELIQWAKGGRTNGEHILRCVLYMPGLACLLAGAFWVMQVLSEGKTP